MSSLERFFSRRIESRISFSFLRQRFSLPRKKFFTTCCVMVEAPSRFCPLSASTTAARTRENGLNPGCL